MHIFRRIFLSNYWWQKSDIWSQVSYKYAILWETFLDPSDSYFLFADLVGFLYTLNIYAHFSSHFSQHVKRTTDDERQVMAKAHVASRQTGSKNLMGPKTLPTIWYISMTLVTKYQISAIDSYWEKCDEKYLGRTDGRTEVKRYTPLPLRGAGV
jgi:hypothetical protein